MPINFNGETYVPLSFKEKFPTSDESTLDVLNEIAHVDWWRFSYDEDYLQGWMDSNSYCS